ncbi:hypothetical protein V1515DRAFT_577191 [Lipomyces mesembrius]
MKSIAYCAPPPPPPRPLKRPLRGARPYRQGTSPKLLTPPPQARSKAYPLCDVASMPLGTPQKTPLQVSPVAKSYLGVHCANNSGSRERQIHRGNAHHEHIFADDLVYSPKARPQSESLGWSPALPKSVVRTKTRRLRVSSVPILLSPPPLLPKDLKTTIKYRGIVSTPASPTNHRRKNRISSVPLPPAPCSPKFPPAPFPHRGRPTLQRGSQPRPSCDSARSPSVVDLAFAPRPEAPMPKLWKKAVKKVIGIEGVREYAEVMAEARDGGLKSAVPSPASLLVSRLKIKRTKKFNLNDAIYGSIGKEITVDEDEERERRKAVLARLMDDYPDWQEIRDSENDGREPCVDARLAQRSIASIPVRTSSIIVVNRLQPAVNDHESGNALVFDSVHTLGEGTLSPVTMATSLYESNADEQLDWADLPSVAPLNIRRASNGSRRRSMAGMGLLDLQALLVARISAANTASKSGPNLEILGIDMSKFDTEALGKRVARKRISILSRALLSSTMGAIRKDRSKWVMLSRKRLRRAQCMFAPAESDVPAGSLATGPCTFGASVDDEQAAERISDCFLRFTQSAPLLRYFAIPIELAKFVMTLVLFPPRSSELSCPLDVFARKEALRATVMDAMVVGEFICFVWFVYQTCAALQQAFMLVGILCYPIVAVLGMFVRGM